MEKKYVVKDFFSQLYWGGEFYQWSGSIYAEFFDTIEDAEYFIGKKDGVFQIETVYL